MSTDAATAEHFRTLRELLELEAEEASRRARERIARLTPEEAERVGISLVDLTVVDERAEAGGLFVLELAKRNQTLGLPWTRIGVGDPVLLSAHEQPGLAARGVIFSRRDRKIAVAFSGEPPELDPELSIRLDLSGDEVTTKRQKLALSRALAAREDRLAELRDVLVGVRPASFDDTTEVPPTPRVNAEQRAAITQALAAQDVMLIHGPPGTGKTSTVVELIALAVRNGESVLATAPSNLAVDNLMERLVARGLRVVRLGHPARVLPELIEHSISVMVERDPDVRLARNLVRNAFALRRKADKKMRTREARAKRAELRLEAKDLLRDARRLEAGAVYRILGACDVVCATTSVDDVLLKGRRFDRVVIDEACQSTEPGAWPPITYGDRLVLAGDHRQLPPTILSREAAERGLGVSLFERLMARDGPRISTRLERGRSVSDRSERGASVPSAARNAVVLERGRSVSDRSERGASVPSAARNAVVLETQYRMHASIMSFPSRELYDGALRAAPEVAGHLLCELPGVEHSELTSTPLEMIDTAGAGWDESVEPDGESRLNLEEARFVAARVRALVTAGVAPRHIGVITPYAAQARHLGQLLQLQGLPDLEVDTVDGFQGREKEAILISLVRSNDRQEIGFLEDIRRMNVALTRARRKLIVVGDGATLGGHPFYARMIESFEAAGAYRTIWELPDLHD